MIEIDGAHGEGGGQILRTTLALSALLQRPTRITDIRAGRRSPGLRPQHLTALLALQEITSATVKGATLGSTVVEFRPGAARPGRYTFNVATSQASAGSIGLVYQAIAPVLALAKGRSELTIHGGTHVKWAPPTTYIERIFLPTVGAMGFHGELRTDRWGWYPRGGGQCCGWLGGARPVGLQLEDRGELERISGASIRSNLSDHITQRQKRAAIDYLEAEGIESPIEIQEQEVPADGPGTCLFLCAEYERSVAGFVSLGERGKQAEIVAKEVAEALLDFHRAEAAIDPFLVDQLIPYLALAQGRSAITTTRLTPHLLTNIWVCQQMLELSFHVEGEGRTLGRITVDGVGLGQGK